MQFTAAILHEPGSPLRLEQVFVGPLRPGDVLVRIKAAGLCHTDLEVMQGGLSFPTPIVLGHEAAGVVEAVGDGVHDLRLGAPVVLSWNPRCGQCFYCDRNLPILCDSYVQAGPKAFHFDGQPRCHLLDGRPLHQLMFLGGFAEYCVVPRQLAIEVPAGIPHDAACLIGCGVMTGAGAALNIAQIEVGDTVAVIGCGAVGLSAVQGARLAGASKIIAVDLEPAKLRIAQDVGATHVVAARTEDPTASIRALTDQRGADVILESAGSAQVYRTTMEAIRPGGQVIWLGKVPVDKEVSFRWGSLMGEKRIRRSSYGGARPARDFPRFAHAYLDGKLNLDALISRRISLGEINEGFDALARGETIRSVVTF